MQNVLYGGTRALHDARLEASKDFIFLNWNYMRHHWNTTLFSPLVSDLEKRRQAFIGTCGWININHLATQSIIGIVFQKPGNYMFTCHFLRDFWTW